MEARGKLNMFYSECKEACYLDFTIADASLVLNSLNMFGNLKRKEQTQFY